MKKIFASIIIVSILVMVGCTTKIPFETSPEKEIRIEYMEEMKQNYSLYKEMYDEYIKIRALGGLKKPSEEFTEFLENMKATKTKEYIGRFADNGDKLALLKMGLTNRKEEYSQEIKELVDNYLKATRLQTKVGDYLLTPELKACNPEEKVLDYLNKNKITIEEIIFPETFEKIDYDVYPLKHTYRYVLKGSVKGKSFEKEIVQDFYIGFDWSDMKNVQNQIEDID